MSKSIALAGLVVFLLGLIVFQYYITSVPDLESPIAIDDARFIEKDNTLLLSLAGSEGRNFTIGLRGDVTNRPEEAALFFISNPDLVPYVYWPGHRSNDEKRVLELLGIWVEGQDQPGLFENLDGNNVKPEGQNDRKIAAAYQIYSVLKDRN